MDFYYQATIVTSRSETIFFRPRRIRLRRKKIKTACITRGFSNKHKNSPQTF